MTHEAERAVNAALQFEGKKDALRQTQDGGVKVTFSINPVDMPPSLYADAMGQRYMIVIVPLNDDETPRQTEKPKNYTAAAKLLAQNEAFQKYAVARHEGPCDPEDWIEFKCGVKSCSQIIYGTEAGKKFAALYAEFQEHLRWG